MKLTKKVEALVSSRGMTNHQLEKALGFSNGTVKRWDESSPSIDKVMRLANYFEITVDQFLDIEPNDKFTVAWESRSKKTVIVYAKSEEEAHKFLEKRFLRA